VLAQFLGAGFMKQGEWYETGSGTPQGGVICPILCNLALDGMEALLARHFTLNGRGGRDSRKAARSKVHLVRYADDFLVTAATPEVAEEARALLVPFLAERGLELSEEKTLVTGIGDGFDFLGWNFRKYAGTMMVRPSKGSVQRFVRETHDAIIVRGRGMTAEELARTLTPKVRGFAGYHIHTCCSKAFAHIAYVMWQQLRRWASRRHPRKGARWVRRRYWRRVGNNENVFSTDGCVLAPITWYHVVRHVALRTDMNPYLDVGYFEERQSMLRRRRSKSFRMPAPVA
jgi:RNA-directed DNA polymerase